MIYLLNNARDILHASANSVTDWPGIAPFLMPKHRPDLVLALSEDDRRVADGLIMPMGMDPTAPPPPPGTLRFDATTSEVVAFGPEGALLQRFPTVQLHPESVPPSAGT